MAPLETTRLALHALAEHVISPLRVQRTGNEIALTARPGGFGTPELPGGGWVGVEGTSTVVVGADGRRDARAVTTLADAAAHVGLERLGVPDRPLELDPDAAARLAAVLGAGSEALEVLRGDAVAGDDPSPVLLWPEHFDAAIELGPEGARATYGVSPGDEAHPEPYAYVGPWSPPPDLPQFNATAFPGAEASAHDAEGMLAFWRAIRALL